jgi:hypothetical protein
VDADETREWLKDWRGGQFSPSYDKDGWPIEMHGLAMDVEALLEDREQARNLAQQYEEIIAWYRRIEPLRFSKKDAQHPDLVRRQQRV